METDQFQKGLTNVLGAIQEALERSRVSGAEVNHDSRPGHRETVHVVITIGQQSEGQYFDAEELEDCGEAIDAPAALKIRMLVSHFVGRNTK